MKIPFGCKRAAAIFLTLGLVAGLACAEPSAGAPASAGGMTHRMMMLIMQLGAILFAAKLGNMLFEKLKLPGVLGELCAGLIIGPYLLGALPLPGLLPDGLFPMHDSFPVSPELYGICSLAAIILLFMTGLETDIKLFLRYSIAGSLVGVGGVAASFLLGNLTGVFFSPMLFGRQLGFLSPACLFLGIISTATSVGITARVLSDQRKLDSPEGVTILAGAVIDDVLGIILLAIGMGVISGLNHAGAINWPHIGLIAAKAIGIWLAATVIGLLAAHKISFLLKTFRDRSAIASMALGLALLLAGLFEEAGLAMIVGAYVMGLSLSKADIAHVIREKLEPIYALLVPVFFTGMGMLVNLRLLNSRSILVFGAVYTLVAFAAKIVGCALPALACRFNLRGALRIGCGMLPRGEVALIISGIGLAAGLLNPEVFGVSVLMTLATTLVAPPILIGLFHNPAAGIRQNAGGNGAAKPTVFHFPSPRTVKLLADRLTEIFEAEGFFVHTLSHDEQIYQVRKGHTVISMTAGPDSISFDCPPADIPFVNTAMYEVLAELEQTIRELRAPIDHDAIGKTVQSPVREFSPHSSMLRFLDAGALQPRLQGNTKQDVTEELLAMLNRQGLIADMAAARQAVFQREQVMSTGMQYGIAIPHGRTPAVNRLVCAVGLKQEGVEFDSIDGLPARIIILTLSPVITAAPHVQFMSSISQILDENGRRQLLACRTAEEMFVMLTRTEQGSARRRRRWFHRPAH